MANKPSSPLYNDGDMDKNNRIAILGGGPAGLSLAMYLEKKGYANYVIYEKSGRVGGKCCSPIYNGAAIELGAVMGAPSYYAVKDVEEYCGITHDGPSMKREFKRKDGTVYDPFDGNDPKNVPHMKRIRKQLARMALLLETKYKGYDVNGHRGVAFGRYEGDAATPSRAHIEGENPNLKDLSLPFKEFCKLNKVPLIQEMWIGPFTPFGYGYFDEIPAAYVLKYLDMQTLLNFTKINLWTWKEGTESIWRRLNEKLMHPAALNSLVTSIERKDGKVFLAVNGREEVFDILVITSPLDQLGSFMKLREEEQEHFSKILTVAYDTFAVDIEKGDYPEHSYYILENMTPTRRGHLQVYYKRDESRDDLPIVTYSIRSHLGKRTLSYKRGKAMVLADLSLAKNKASKVLEEHSWYYFPHVDSSTYASGWYDEVEAMQGKENTFYAGEVMSFGDMDEVSEYSRELVARFF